MVRTTKEGKFDKRFKGSRTGYGMGPYKDQPPELKMVFWLLLMFLIWMCYNGIKFLFFE